MLDIGFSELLLLAIIGLIVLGPERLPKVARSVGQWTGRARAYVRQMSAELDREVQRAEMKKYIDESRKILNQRIDLDDNASPSPGAESNDKDRHGQTPRQDD